MRDATAQMAAADAACTSGKISDPLQAYACLTNPAVWTGQTGSAVTLLGVTKPGCAPEVAGTQYHCSFQQELRLDITGAEAIGATRWGI